MVILTYLEWVILINCLIIYKSRDIVPLNVLLFRWSGMVNLTYPECAILMNCLICYKSCNTVPLKCTGTIYSDDLEWWTSPTRSGPFWWTVSFVINLVTLSLKMYWYYIFRWSGMVNLTYPECAILMNCLICYKSCNTVPLKCTGTIYSDDLEWWTSPTRSGPFWWTVSLLMNLVTLFL